MPLASMERHEPGDSDGGRRSGDIADNGADKAQDGRKKAGQAEPEGDRDRAFGILGALTLGAGMCMVMVFEGMVIYGMIIGVVGIMLLLCLVPMIKGVYKEDTKKAEFKEETV